MANLSSSTDNFESEENNFVTRADLDSLRSTMEDRFEILKSLLVASLPNPQANARSTTPPSTPAAEFSTANTSAKSDPNSFTAALKGIGVTLPASPSTASVGSADNYVSSRLPKQSLLPSTVTRDAVVSVPYKPFEKVLDESPSTFKIFFHYEGFKLHKAKHKVYDHSLLDSLSQELIQQLISDNRHFLTMESIKMQTNEEILGLLYKRASGTTLAALRGALLIGIDYFYMKHPPITASAHNTKEWLTQSVAYIDFFEKYYNIIMAHKPPGLSVQMKGKIVTEGEEKEDCFYDLFFRKFPCKSLGNAIRTHFSNLSKMSESDPNGAPTDMLKVFPRTRDSILDDIEKLATVNYALLALPSSSDSPRKPSHAQTPTHTSSFQHSRGTPYRADDNARRHFRPSFNPSGAHSNNGSFHGPRGQPSSTTLANVSSYPSDERSHLSAEDFLLESVVSHDGSIHNPYVDDPEETRDESSDAGHEHLEDSSLNALIRGQAQQDTSQLPCHSMALSRDKKCANQEAGKTCRYSHSPSVLSQYARETFNKLKESPYLATADTR